MISYPPRIDKSIFLDQGPHKVLYGLPEEIVYCEKCTMSNQKPNSEVEYKHSRSTIKKTMYFENGVCDACRVADHKHNAIDWAAREEELLALCDQYRSKDGSYDCLVPGSGGKDSVYASHILKNKYGMHPLTVTWAPHIYTDWGWKNFQAWIHSGVDNYLITPNGNAHRVLTRLALENLLHPFQPFMLGQMLVAPRFAKRMGIQLVFYGENPVEYGNPIVELDSSKKDTSYFSSEHWDDVFISGVSVSELLGKYGLSMCDVKNYLPIQTHELEEANLDVRYLGHYLKWHPQSCYYYAMEHCGFNPSPERTVGTYSKYSSIDDKIDDIHYYTTGVKFGIGRASYDSCQEIRSGDITRDEGISLVKQYDHEYPSRFLDEILEYLSLPSQHFSLASKQFESPLMDKEYFDILVDNFRSPHLWRWKDSKWTLRHSIDALSDVAKDSGYVYI
jgi:N-acetyl sugar amidotransferase